MLNWLALAAIALYLAALQQQIGLYRKLSLPSLPWWLSALAALLHVSATYFAGLDFFGSLAWVSGLMALLSSVLLARRGEVFLPSVANAIAVVALLLLLIFGKPNAQPNDWQIQLHAAIALLAYALLSLAALQALLLLLSERALRSLEWRWLSALPPLSRLERHLFALIWAGFTGLTLTLLSGGLFISDWFAQHLVHKTVLTLAAWLVFALLLLAHTRFGLRGRTAAIWTLTGMGLLLLAFFGSKLVLEIILQRT